MTERRHDNTAYNCKTELGAPHSVHSFSHFSHRVSQLKSILQGSRNGNFTYPCVCDKSKIFAWIFLYIFKNELINNFKEIFRSRLI